MHAPTFGNSYPFADIELSNVIFMPGDAGLNALFTVCTQRAGATARALRCEQIGRVLTKLATRAATRSTGWMLLDALHRFDAADIARARENLWRQETYIALHTRTSDSRPDVATTLSFVDDWLATGSEVDAQSRALARAGKSLLPPANFRLNDFSLPQFRAAEASANAQ